MGWFNAIKGQVEHQRQERVGGALIGIHAHRAMLVQIVNDTIKRGCEKPIDGKSCLEMHRNEDDCCGVCFVQSQVL